MTRSLRQILESLASEGLESRLRGRTRGGEHFPYVVSVDLCESRNVVTVTATLVDPAEGELDFAISDKRVHIIAGQGKGPLDTQPVESGFRRTVMLPSDTDMDALRASFGNGVLRLVIPRSADKDT